MELWILFVVIFIISPFVVGKFYHRGIIILSVKEFSDEGPCYIRLEGRHYGMINWFLSSLNIRNSYACLNVFADHIECSESRLSGEIQEHIPLTQISKVAGGEAKPIAYIFMAIFVFLVGTTMSCLSVINFLFSKPAMLVVGFAVTFVISLLFFLAYLHKKRTVVSIEMTSGNRIVLSFENSPRLQQSLSRDEAMQTASIISQLVLMQK